MRAFVPPRRIGEVRGGSVSTEVAVLKANANKPVEVEKRGSTTMVEGEAVPKRLRVDVVKPKGINKVAASFQDVAQYVRYFSDALAQATAEHHIIPGNPCKVLKPGIHPQICVRGAGKAPQWDLRNTPGIPQEFRVRVILPRAALLFHSLHFNVPFSADTQASHICHNAACLNAEHIVYEPQQVNLSRNFCGGPGHCQHEPACIIAGSQHEKITDESQDVVKTMAEIVDELLRSGETQEDATPEV